MARRKKATKVSPFVKYKIPIILIVVIGLVVLAMNTMTTQVPYTDTEEYTEQEPYTAQECGNEIEPYTEEECGFELIFGIPIPNCEDVTKTRMVNKCHDVTRYRTVYKTRDVTKYRTMTIWNSVFSSYL